MSKSKGRKKTEEWKLKMSIIMKENCAWKGKKLSEETRSKMSATQRLVYATGKRRHITKEESNESVARMNASRTTDTYDKMSISLKKYFVNHDNAFKGKHHSEETKKILSEKIKKRIKDGRNYGFEVMAKEKLRELSRRMVSKSNARPNKFELSVFKLINKAIPNGYNYTGNASFPISGMYPDFVSTNGKKKVIEAFGDYWHGVLVKGEKFKELEQKRIDAFKLAGYDCLVLWENDLKKPHQDIVLAIRKFSSE